jgi:hypothetical protein
MFPLTALNRSTVCVACSWGLWKFIKSCSNHKNITSEALQTRSSISRFHNIKTSPVELAACQLPHICVLFVSLHNFRQTLYICFRHFTQHTVEFYCGKHKNCSSNFVTICYTIPNVFVHLSHFLHMFR